jgi:hypothetical protein
MKVKQAALEVEKEKLKVQKLRALKEAQETTGEVRSMLLDLLGEVFAPEPPAGMAVPGGRERVKTL